MPKQKRNVKTIVINSIRVILLLIFLGGLSNDRKLIIFMSYNLAKAEVDGLNKLKTKANEAKQKGYKIIGLTASGPEEQLQMSEHYGLNFDFYFCDETALKTIVRSNPGILELNNGTILQKLHWSDLEDLKLE